MKLSTNSSPGRISCLLILLIMSEAIYAERLPIRSYTTLDGLAHSTINRIVRDSRGFLWFCTADGLSRFDGYAFTNFGTDEGLPHRSVTDLLETRKGEYWVATRAGLVRFNPKAAPENRITYWNAVEPAKKSMFTVIDADDEHLRPVSISVLLEGRDGAIWCGTDSGLFRLEDASGHLGLQQIEIGIPSDWAEGWQIWDLLESKDGSVWAATPGGMYRRWPDGTAAHYTKENGLPDNYLHDLFEDHCGQLWAGTRYGGFFRFVADDTHKPPVVAASYSTGDGMPSPWVFQIFEASDRKLWIATNRGLLQFSPNGDESGRLFHQYSERNGLSYYDITTLNEDLGGNLWMGTNNAGAMRLERNGFVTYDRRDGIYGIDSIFEDRTGAVCFRGVVYGDSRTSVFEGAKADPLGATPDYHYLRLGRFDGQHFAWFQPHAVSDMGWICEGVTLQTRSGEWWVAGLHGIVRFPPSDRFDQIKESKPLAVYNAKDGMGKDEVFRMFEDSKGNVWISTMSPKPVVLWERDTGTIRDLTAKPALWPDGKMPRSYGEDLAGNVWLGLDGEIARYHNGRVTWFNANDGVPPGIITSVYRDHEGRLWLSSSRGGLLRVDNPEAERPAFVSYTIAQGLSSNSTEVPSYRLIVEDLQGRIYIPTGRGLDRLDPATGNFLHFTTADGLASGSFRSSFRDRRGGLWFGTSGGLSHFVPPSEDHPLPPPPILISDLIVAGSRRFISALGETDITLPELTADQNQLRIDFIGLSFAPGQVLHYQHKLEGTDEDWSPPTEQRNVNYRLSPGRYKFLVRAVSSDGTVSSSPAVVRFRILPPVWARWWFLMLVGTVLTLILYWLYRYRVARLVELERVRTRIASDLHDDIGANLTKIAILSEVAYQQLLDEEKRKDSPLSSIARISRESVASMSDIVWAVNPKRDQLRDLTRRMRSFASDTLTARNISFQFRAPDVEQSVNLAADVRRGVFLIYKEAINNIVRHSSCSEAIIDTRIVERCLELRIVDNGKGFDSAFAGEGQGLISMRKRAEGFGGTLEVASIPGQGTTVTLRVPVGGGGWFPTDRIRLRIARNGS